MKKEEKDFSSIDSQYSSFSVFSFNSFFLRFSRNCLEVFVLCLVPFRRDAFSNTVASCDCEQKIKVYPLSFVSWRWMGDKTGRLLRERGTLSA